MTHDAPHRDRRSARVGRVVLALAAALALAVLAAVLVRALLFALLATSGPLG